MIPRTCTVTDRDLLSSKFVNPRVNPVRKDAAVMTHESEMVNMWE